MSLIKIGVAGIGSMGLNHCRILKSMKNVEFIGVYDIDQERSEQVAKVFAVSVFSSYEKLIHAVDAVIIAVPTSSHYSLTLQAIQRGKHVLVEKPFVSSLKEAEQLRRMVEKEPVVVQVGHVERFNPAFKQLSETVSPHNVLFIEARRFGVPNRQIDTDVILDIMIHDIDIVLQLINSPLSTVTGVGYYTEEGKRLEAASALLSFQNGCYASLFSSRLSLEKKRSVYVTEQDRFLKANLLTKELYIYHKADRAPAGTLSCPPENVVGKIIVPHANALYLELEHFLQAIQLKQHPKVGIHEASKVLEVALKIKEQIEKSQHMK
ncbi:Gfo/Idh/MocA family oxidoreductase [Bacillus sp. B190/17]|uniref:Gfo/Idh/MocA family oxidoreductase n=1 Tax=Bacillus lumedeiriae TaxID=3058829 RepID=A0ABW8I9H5_9BACI